MRQARGSEGVQRGRRARLAAQQVHERRESLRMVGRVDAAGDGQRGRQPLPARAATRAARRAVLRRHKAGQLRKRRRVGLLQHRLSVRATLSLPWCS
jgi:hypothetical protein